MIYSEHCLNLFIVQFEGTVNYLVWEQSNIIIFTNYYSSTD